MYLSLTEQYSIIVVVLIADLYSVLYFYSAKNIYDILLYNAKKRYGIVSTETTQ